jgi:hypothetical protein
VALGVLGSVSSFSNAWRNGRIDLPADDLARFVGDWVVRAVQADPQAVGSSERVGDPTVSRPQRG